jgi:hypothetical protein
MLQQRYPESVYLCRQKFMKMKPGTYPHGWENVSTTYTSTQPLRGPSTNARRCFCCIASEPPGGPAVGGNGCGIWLINVEASKPVCLALGLRGERAGRAGGGVGSPVTRRRIGGWLPSASRDEEDSADLESKPEKGRLSVPRACRRAFSCFAWTARKWLRRSCHLISSRPILERVASGLAVLRRP